MNSTPKIESGAGRDDLSSSEKEAALARILASSEFTQSPKLGDFLSYVVGEQIAGRSERIKGKTIAVDVFGRDAGEGSAGHNIVRVEARRLRRLLDEYYNGGGSDDPVRLFIDSGGYVPRFEYRHTPETPTTEAPQLQPAIGSATVAAKTPDPGLRRRNLFVAAAIFATAVAVWGIFWQSRDDASDSLADSATRLALRDYSVRALQAKDTATVARALYFPVFDVRRQTMALGMFDYAIELAPEISDGHAGAAQALATLHLLAPTPEDAEALLARATFHAEEAMRIAPSDPWAVAAMSWVMAQSGEVETAKQKIRIAVELAPEDGDILDLAGVVSIYVNDPGFAADVANRQRAGSFSPGTRNIWGLANLMLGNNRETIASFENAPTSGSVITAPSLLFQAIAHDRLGEKQRARQIVREISETWPDFPVEFVARRVFKNSPEITQEIIERVSDLRPPS